MKEKHCCFNTSQDFVCSARIHVPLAEKCSMGCVYCNYYQDGNITNCSKRPGTANKLVIGNSSIKTYLRKAFALYPDCDIIGVSGPGEPLENYEQVELLQRIILEVYPEKTLCICSNGNQYVEFVQLVDTYKNIKYFTITINSLDPKTVQRIYRSIDSYSKALDLIDRQLAIIKHAKLHEIKIKVNTVYLVGINDHEILQLFSKLKQCGVECFNLLNRVPIIRNPQKEVNYEYYEYLKMRDLLIKEGIPLTQQCRQCKSDFCGY